VRAFMHLVEHRRNQELLMETPAACRPEGRDAAAARKVVEAARAAGRTTLSDPEARALLKAYGVPVVEDRIVSDPAGAGAAAAELGGQVALKILSAEISHKSDVGGVALNLEGAEAVEAAARAMLDRVAAERPDAQVEGFVVQPLIVRRQAHELLCGVARDPAFGPVILFGQGGIATEVLADRSIGLPPLNDVLARDMIRRTKVARLLGGYRNRPAADVEAVVGVLTALSDLVTELPEIAELDINPLLADAEGVICLDARVRLAHGEGQGARPAILPYPQGMERTVQVDGLALQVRPIRPQDAPKIADLVDRSTPEDVRLRFASGFRHLPAGWAPRLSQIDYDREMALVAENAEGEILGVGRLVGDPEGRTAEFALMVRSDVQHRGLGGLLLNAVVEHAKARGYQEVWGDVARRNERMLALAAELGFGKAPAEDLTRVKVVKALDLAPPQAEPA